MKEDIALRRQIKDTLLFLGFLLLAGFLHSADMDIIYWGNTLIYCTEYLIYAGLILSWLQALRQRLLPTRSKGYLLASACLLLLFVAAQFTKYRLSVTPGLTRYCWYAYYLPIILVPTLFLMTCIRIRRGFDGGRRTERGKPDEILLLIPAGILTLGILTNDLHQMAFRANEGILHQQAFLPNEGIAGLTGSPGTYTHGFLYYAAYGWAGTVTAAGVFVLIAACGKRGSWKKALGPLSFLALMPLFIEICELLPEDFPPVSYQWPEVFIFCMIGVFEACLQNRLIPSNINYPGVFSRMDLPLLVTDREFCPVYRTRCPVSATTEQMKESLTASVYPEADTRLSGMTVRAGYAFRTEDESAVNRLNAELRDAVGLLEQENDILEKERRLNAELAGIEERSQLYQKAAREIYPTQKKISRLLNDAGPNTASFRSDIEKVLALTAYAKRKANFVLIEAERETVSAGELASALTESAHYLRYCGMNATVEIETERRFPCRLAMAVYDCFETIAETLLGKAGDLFIRLGDQELMVMADGGEVPDLSVLPLPGHHTREDGASVFRFDLGEGGGAE